MKNGICVCVLFHGVGKDNEIRDEWFWIDGSIPEWWFLRSFVCTLNVESAVLSPALSPPDGTIIIETYSVFLLLTLSVLRVQVCVCLFVLPRKQQYLLTVSIDESISVAAVSCSKYEIMSSKCCWCDLHSSSWSMSVTKKETSSWCCLDPSFHVYTCICVFDVMSYSEYYSTLHSVDGIFCLVLWCFRRPMVRNSSGCLCTRHPEPL